MERDRTNALLLFLKKEKIWRESITLSESLKDMTSSLHRILIAE